MYFSKPFYIKNMFSKMGKILTKGPGKKKNKLNNKIKQSKKMDNNKVDLSKNTKPKSMRKKIFLIIFIIALVGIIIFVWFLIKPEGLNAQLVIESGTVQVKHGSETWISAENGMLLYKSDSVRTGNNSSASIIFFKTSLVRLDSNTEVTLEELFKEEETGVTIQQNSGRTWNTIYKISGINNYEVQTPTTIASVRGTAFEVIVWENGSTYYGVSHGILNVTSISNGVIQDSIDVSGNESTFVFIDMIHKSLEIVPFEMDEWALENLIKDQQFVDDLKAELYSRIKGYIPQLKAEFGINDEEIDALLEGYILGYFELPDDTPSWIKDLFKF
jgi:hypothetical protein